MNKSWMRRNFKILWISILLMVLTVPLVINALDTVETGFRIDAADKVTNSDTIIKVDAHGVCKLVGNASNNSYFIPTRTSLEWYLFRTYLPETDPPGEVYLLECSSPPPTPTKSSGTDIYWHYYKESGAKSIWDK